MKIEIANDFSGYTDSKGQKIEIVKGEHLYVQLPGSDVIVDGMVSRTQLGQDPYLVLADAAGDKFAKLDPGTRVVAHYDMCGVELLRDPSESIDASNQIVSPDVQAEAKKHFEPSADVTDDDYRTTANMTFSYQGTPPNADKTYGMIQYYGNGELQETIYYHTKEGFEKAKEDPDYPMFDSWVNPKYRTVLGLQNPSPFESAKKQEFRFEAGEDMRERVMQKLEDGVKALFDTEQYKDYLRTMSKFHDYSFNNTILLYLQKPDVEVVAGFRAWQEKFDRSVRKGERGLKIIVPHPYKEKNFDPKTGITTEIERLGFGIGTVFDVSQTDGKDLTLSGFQYKKPDGNFDKYDEIREAIEQVAGIPVTYVDVTSASKGAWGVYLREENRIEIKNGTSQSATLETLIHETAHSILHADAKELASRGATRRAIEVEAESVSFVVCDHLGIDTSAYSFAYIAGWSKDRTTPELRESAERIHETAHKLIEQIDKAVGIAKRTKNQDETKTATAPARASRGR